VLTRLLEEPLSRAAERSGVAAVVHVSSVTHRYAAIAPDASAFLRTWEHGSYAASKLANVVFANECQRRWWEAGKRIVSVAVDPGAVFSNLWLRDAFFSKPPALFLLRTLYAPPTDGATAVVFACLVPFHEEGNEKSVDAEERGNADLSDGCDGSDANPKTSAAETAAAMAGAYFPRDIPREIPKTKTKASLVRTFEQETTLCCSSRFRFYARGLFATELVVRWGPKDSREAKSRVERMRWFARYAVWGVATLLCTALDWPMRRLFRTTAEVPSSPGSYDERTGAALWEEAGEAAGLAGR
jgi:WW domain-containing oxidoreductase